LKGVDETFDMLKHAERSIYIEVFWIIYQWLY
jgi:hypothetical protein